MRPAARRRLPALILSALAAVTAVAVTGVAVTGATVAGATGLPRSRTTASTALAPATTETAGTAGTATAATVTATPESLPTLRVGQTFDGAVRGNVGPPDTQIAVSPAWVVEFVNDQFEVWPRSGLGGPPALMDNDCEWAGLSWCADPRATYDPVAHRFFAAVEGEDYLVVAVSAGPDPTGAWFFQRVRVPDRSLDQPRLAITSDKVIAGDSGFDIWVFQKSDFLAATAGPLNASMVHLSVGGDATVGAIALEAGDPSVSAGYAEIRGGTDRTALQVEVITGTPASRNVRATPTLLHVPYPWQDPVNAPQQGGPLLLSPGDFYPATATLGAGSMWFAMTEPCRPPTDSVTRDCVHLVRIDVTGAKPRLVYEAQIGEPQAYLLDPAVAVDTQGRPVIVATETSAAMHPSVVGIAVGADGVGGPPVVLRAGDAYTGTDDDYGKAAIRWGDYSATAVDPTDPDQLWLAGEFALNLSQWGTSFSAVTVSDPSAPVMPPTPPADFTGDGHAERALWRPSTGQWFLQGQPTVRYGRPGDIPVPANYTGDGHAERALWRPSTGQWFVQGQPTVRYGRPGDIPVPANYTGDRRAERALWRPSTGQWFVQGQPTVRYGRPDDIPVPANYTGDRRAERALWRPTTGQWFVQGQPTVRYGRPGDIPT